MNTGIVQEVFRFPGRPTRVIVDLDAITSNLGFIRSAVGPSVRIMAVVKANAYGHGAIAVSQAAIDAGVEQLAVATVDEAVQLRIASIHAPILVLGPIDDSEIDLAIGHSIDLAVGSVQFAQSVGLAAEQFGIASPIRVHLKIDTGMHRFGLAGDEAIEVARFIAQHPLLKLHAVFSHFSQSDEHDEVPTLLESERLDLVLKRLSDVEIRPAIVHQANSAATMRGRSYDRQMIRVGIAMYGLDPSAEVQVLPGMRPAMTLVSRIARIIELSPGDGVSYGATFRATDNMRAALVPIGYADGYPRALSNCSYMYVHGEQCKVLGRVCMDQTVVHLPDTIGGHVGDPIVVAGAWESEGVQSLTEIATMVGTINYEIAVQVAPRVPRFYVRTGKVVAIADLFGFSTRSESGQTKR